MKKVKNFIGKYGFFMASFCFFISYITDDSRDLSILSFVFIFFVMGLSSNRKK